MSFKRKGQAQTIQQRPGTRPSGLTTSVFNISTGIPSLDDILGGGLPLGSVFVVLAPDPHAAYADILQRYFVAQGIAAGHYTYIIDNNALNLASSCMWVSKAAMEDPSPNEDSTEQLTADSGVRIAWRYEKMKQFQTSIRYNESAQDAYCHPFDLTCRIPENVLESSVASSQLHYIPVSSMDQTISQLQNKFAEVTTDVSPVIRVSIPDLGSPEWGDVKPKDILRFLYHMRSLARRSVSTSHVCFFVTLPSYFSQDSWGGPGWSQKLGWLSDGCIALRSFSADPALLSIFPSHHGLIDIHTLPSLNSLVPPSDKISELRGLSTSETGGGENNLAFKCTRKRFAIETLHLDMEGGVNERRTTAPSEPRIAKAMKIPAAATVEVSVEDSRPAIVKKKGKKSVAFQSDRPDLYDF